MKSHALALPFTHFHARENYELSALARNQERTAQVRQLEQLSLGCGHLLFWEPGHRFWEESLRHHVAGPENGRPLVCPQADSGWGRGEGDTLQSQEQVRRSKVTCLIFQNVFILSCLWISCAYRRDYTYNTYVCAHVCM